MAKPPKHRTGEVMIKYEARIKELEEEMRNDIELIDIVADNPSLGDITKGILSDLVKRMKGVLGGETAPPKEPQ